MAKEILFLPLPKSTIVDNGSTIKWLDLENIIIAMVVNMKVIGRTTSQMDLGGKLSQISLFMKAIMMMAKNKIKENFISLMVQYMKEISSTI